MKKREKAMPLNLQFFAEDPEPIGNEGGSEGGEGGQEEETFTVEDLMAQLAAERAEKEKYKTSFNKASSEASEYKKKLRAKQTAEETEQEEKAKQQEEYAAYVKGLESKLSLIETKNYYLDIGMPADLAEETAKAELEGDKDTVATNYRKHMESVVKAKEAEWIKSRPDPNAGNGEDDDTKDPFLAGFEN